MVKILTDSTSDISPLLAKKLGIDIIPLSVNFTSDSYREGVEISPKEFFMKLRSAKKLPTTSQPSPEDFIAHFETAKKSGDELLTILISEKLSGTFQSAMIAKEIVGYDGIYVIDSMNTTTGLRLLVEHAVYLRGKGNTAQTILKNLNSAIPKVRLIAVVDTLEYLYKGGRLSLSKAVAGSLFSIKPIIRIKDGKVDVVGKERGANRAISALVDSVDPKSIDYSVPIYFGYTEKRELCNILMEETEKRILANDIRISEVGAVIGTHAGPNCCVLTYLSN
ncbi:MAG: DegV family protein [Ruminococcaceae bacterium]|nr:DegV family protein [Oscillospiraceae bacterium]